MHSPLPRLLLLLAAAAVAEPAANPPTVTRERPKPPAPASGAAVESMPDMDPPVNSIEIAAQGAPIQAKLFADGFEEGFGAWSSLEGGRNESITIAEGGPARAGRQSARVNVIPSDFAHHGNRAEVTHNLGDGPGSEGWYAWSYLIPNDYPEDPDPTAHWQIVTQFHDQPNLAAGQSWEVFPPHNSSVALYLLNRPEAQGSFAMALGFGTNLPKGTWQYGPARIDKGRWIDVLFRIGWSTGDDGLTEAWVDGQRLTPEGGIRGRTLYYQFTDYLKLGMYRNPNITYNSTIYLDELRCGPTRESVALPPMDQAVTGVAARGLRLGL